MCYFVSILVLQSSRWGGWLLCFVCPPGGSYLFVWLFLALPRVCLQFVIVLFHDHTHYFRTGSNMSTSQYVFYNSDPRGNYVWYLVPSNTKVYPCPMSLNYLFSKITQDSTTLLDLGMYFPSQNSGSQLRRLKYYLNSRSKNVFAYM